MKTIKPKIEFLWLGTVDEGKQLEINAEVAGQSTSLATIVAEDKDESLWFEIYVDENAVRIPLSTIQEALEAAKTEVHSETWYEDNVYPDIENT